MNTTTLIEGLAAFSPELQELFAEHLAYYGETLSHVFMGEVSEFVTTLDESSSQKGGDANSLLNALFYFLERAFQAGDDDVQNLLSVSFLENVMERAVESPAFRQRFGPALERELQEVLKAHGYDVNR